MPLVEFNGRACERYLEMCRQHNAEADDAERVRLGARASGFTECYQLLMGTESAAITLCYPADLQYGEESDYPLCWGLAPSGVVIPESEAK